MLKLFPQILDLQIFTPSFRLIVIRHDLQLLVHCDHLQLGVVRQFLVFLLFSLEPLHRIGIAPFLLLRLCGKRLDSLLIFCRYVVTLIIHERLSSTMYSAAKTMDDIHLERQSEDISSLAEQGLFCWNRFVVLLRNASLSLSVLFALNSLLFDSVRIIIRLGIDWISCAFSVFFIFVLFAMSISYFFFFPLSSRA